MHRISTGAARIIYASMLMTFSTTVSALQVDGAVDVDVQYTDNAALTQVNETDDLITTARLSANISDDEGPLTGNAAASLRKLDYMDNTFAGQTYFSLGSTARWEQVENRLVWSVSDFFSQTSIDNLAANTPDNSQDTNAFNLTAAATMLVADRHTITVSPSFSDFYYDSSNNDNQQLGLAASWAYQLDPTISLSLNGSFREADYEDDTTGADNERTSLNIAMAVTRARSRYNVNIGATKVERDMGGESDGVTGAISWQHDFTGRSSLNVLASSNITDTSNTFLSSSIDPNTGTFGNVQVSSEVIRDSIFVITYSRTGSIINSSIWTELRDLDYETAMLDREVQEVGANISIPLSALVSGSVGGSYIRTEEKVSSNTDKRYQVDSRLDYKLSRKLTANAGVQFQTKDSSSVAGREYDELRIFAGIGYRLGR